MAFTALCPARRQVLRADLRKLIEKGLAEDAVVDHLAPPQLPFPRGHVREDVAYRPGTGDPRLYQLRIRQTGIRLVERDPRLVQAFQKLSSVHSTPGRPSQAARRNVRLMRCPPITG